MQVDWIKVKALKPFRHCGVTFEEAKFYLVPTLVAAWIREQNDKLKQPRWLAHDGELGISFKDEQAVDLKKHQQAFIDYAEGKRFKGRKPLVTPEPVAKPNG